MSCKANHTPYSRGFLIRDCLEWPKIWKDKVGPCLNTFLSFHIVPLMSADQVALYLFISIYLWRLTNLAMPAVFQIIRMRTEHCSLHRIHISYLTSHWQLCMPNVQNPHFLTSHWFMCIAEFMPDTQIYRTISRTNATIMHIPMTFYFSKNICHHYWLSNTLSELNINMEITFRNTTLCKFNEHHLIPYMIQRKKITFICDWWK